MNQSVFPCLVLTVASWTSYRFLRKQVKWSGTPIALRIVLSVIHTVKRFCVVNEAEVDVSLEFPCFLHDPMNVGNFISDSSAFSKHSLCIWNFLVYIMPKLSLKDFVHSFASMWNDCNCPAILTLSVITLLWDWNENWPSPVLWPLMSFPNLLTFLVQHFNSLISAALNRRTMSPPLALFIVMLP